MNEPLNLYRLIGYGLLTFVTILGVGLLLGEFYVPIKQYLSGNPADFSKHWEQADIGRRVLTALLFSIALTALRYRREKKNAAHAEQKHDE